MSDPTSRLPARPSLDQLRKQAKEQLKLLREDDPEAKLSEAQYALAKSYGFESWPKLVHHVESVADSGRLERFEQLADDFLAAYGSDEEALDRLIGHFGWSYGREQALVRVRGRVDDARDDPASEPTLADVRELVARQYGFDDWEALGVGLAQPTDLSPPGGPRQEGPPFYTIHPESNTIEPRPPMTDRDWEALFAIMAERRITGLESSALTDSAAARLAELDFVTTLKLDGAPGLSDDGLLQLGRMSQLEHLELGGYHSRLTDRGLAVLRELPRLRDFRMAWAQRVSDVGMAHLAACAELERVHLMGTPTGDGALEALVGKEHLTQVVTGKLLTDRGIRLAKEIPRFRAAPERDFEGDLMMFMPEENALLIDGPFTDEGLASLAGLEGLLAIDFFWHSKAFTADGIRALEALPKLRYLGCQRDMCDDRAMEAISHLPHLRTLMAQSTVASDEGYAALSRSPSLRQLWGRESPNLRSRGFRALSEMPELRGLAVNLEHVDDEALATLSSFSSLTELMPIGLLDDGFAHVGRCAGLEKLWCMYCRDSGDGATEQIASLALTTYYAGATKITDRSLALLGGMETLEEVELYQTAAVTDAGIGELTRLPALRTLTVSDLPRVTGKGVAAFRPEVRVVYNR